jgi:hypothetical protein
LKLKTRVLGAVSTLALAGGMVAIAAPAANATPTVIGGCQGQVGLATLTPAIGDQTQLNVVIKTKLLKDVTTKTAISGDCSSASRPGDAINPAGGLVSPLTPKAMAASLIGNTGCAQGAAIPVDATAAAAWSPSGKITVTMTQTNALAKPWQIQADISFLGSDPSQPTGDVIDVGGIVLKGAAFGAAVSGSIWQAPATLLPKGDPGQPGVYNTGYGLDLVSALGCADATPGNATIGTTLFGGGGSSANSPLGSVAQGLIFSLGQ